jgi:hypothetical protein
MNIKFLLVIIANIFLIFVLNYILKLMIDDRTKNIK